MAGRFPLLTDENVDGHVVAALQGAGWDVLRVVDVFGERSVDDIVFEWAAGQGRALVSTDQDCLRIAARWARQWRPFRLVWWPQGTLQRARPGAFVAAFDALAAKPEPFASPIAYLRPDA